MKTFTFPQPDGRQLVLTQSSEDPTKFSSRYCDGTTIADQIAFLFNNNQVKK